MAPLAWPVLSDTGSDFAPTLDTQDTTGCLCTVGCRRLGRRMLCLSSGIVALAAAFSPKQ